MKNDLTFFTNEPERTLYERFSTILTNNTQFFDVLVGYFRTSGFYRLYDSMENIDKIRILVGLNVDRKTIEIIDSAKTIANLSNAQIKESFAKEVTVEFENSEDSKELEVGVRTFIEWLKCGKLEMRMYPKEKIHAKVYIIRKNEQSENYGSVITGSSNFSESGLINNLEFNVELKDSRDVKFALEKFEELWKDSIDISQTFADTISTETWIRDDITPYELYLKTIYGFFEEEINSDKDKSVEDLLPDGFMKLKYQLDAVVQAKRILSTYGGVFISDVVGLGKTYICAMLANSFKNSRKLIICPPVLLDYWEGVMEDFGVSCKVCSLGKLDSLLEDKQNLARYDYVFIDEAHRFRNSKTESFGKLHEICYGKKVVLISATPINNYTSDIENQLYLFQPKHQSNIIPNEPNLEGFFSKLNSKLSKLDKGTTEYAEQLRKNSSIIRDKLLRHVMVRRTRSEIKEYYKDDLAKQGLKFPQLGNPEKIIYSFDKKTNEIFEETIGIIKKLSYARYISASYLKDKTKASNILSAQTFIGGFMKSILVKRLESSFYAFKMTLSRFIKSYQDFIDMANKGNVYISKKVDVYELLDNGDDEKLMDLVADEKVQHFMSDDFKPEFFRDLVSDLTWLKNLSARWDLIINDPKLEQFKKDMIENAILKSGKKIIFTESKETAKYVGDALKEIFGDKVVVFSGESSPYLKKQIEKSFNPKFIDENEDRYDILITTDVFAEGINLHRANKLINYDLPWNPTRIMQRVGRINRVGTIFDRIYVFNFLPTSSTTAQLPLEERIMEKLQAFHDTLGEDYKYLSDDEVVSSHKLYEILTKNSQEDGNAESMNPELEYLALIRKIRDENIDLFEKIKKLPIKSKSSKKSDLISKEAVLTFFRKGTLKSFYISDEDSCNEITFIEAIQFIKAIPSLKKIKIEDNYYKYLEINKKAFDGKLEINNLLFDKNEKTAMTGNDGNIIKTLKAILSCRELTINEIDNINKMIELFENGEIPDSLSKSIIQAKKNAESELEAYHSIYDKIPSRYFDGRKDTYKEKNFKKQIILSSYLREE